MDEMMESLLSDFRRAYSRWEDHANREANHDYLLRIGGRMRDAMVAMDNYMSRGTGKPFAWPVHPADAHDGTVS